MIVDQDDYDTGGPYKELWRDLKTSAAGWLTGDSIAQAIYSVKVKAVMADLHPSDGTFLALIQAARKVQRETDTQIAHLGRLYVQAGALEAAVTQARLLHVDPPDADGIPLDDDLLERMSALYGIRKPWPEGGRR